MKILIKNKKWETYFNNFKIICDVTSNNQVFNIKFNIGDNEISIKTNNLDNTFRYLEKLFNNMSTTNRLVG